MILNLDPTFNPLNRVEEIRFDNFTFSGGEPHIKILSILDPNQPITVSHRVNSFNDFGLLLMAIDALKRMGQRDISLILPYFPGARQDRVMVKGEALSVKVYADIINSMNLSKITIFDPHSDVTPALLNNCEVISNHSLVAKTLSNLPEDTFLIAPDGGALKKIYKLAAFLKRYDVVECGKIRDVETGELSGFRVNTEQLNNRPCLVVDDICDGGGTFIGLAKELKAKNAGSLYLVISHGIFSKGISVLEAYYENIFTTDSIKNVESNERITQFHLNQLI